MKKSTPSLYELSGSCHCGNLSFEMQITDEPVSYATRSCDCEFCCKHGASYLSDKDGKLTISIIDQSNLQKYRQGSKIADFLLCKQCSVLIGVCCEIQGNLFASINSRTIDGDTMFGETQTVSPQHLSDDERVHRWQEVWFQDVQINYIIGEDSSQ